MELNKYATDPVLIDIVKRVQAGETTRKQAAEAIGISVQALNNRLRRGGFLWMLEKHRDLSAPQVYKMPPEKAALYDKALAEIRAGAKPMAVCRRYPELSFQLLCRKARKQRKEYSNYSQTLPQPA